MTAIVIVAKVAAALFIIVVGVASASVLLDRLVHGASYIRDARRIPHPAKSDSSTGGES